MASKGMINLMFLIIVFIPFLITILPLLFQVSVAPRVLPTQPYIFEDISATIRDIVSDRFNVGITRDRNYVYVNFSADLPPEKISSTIDTYNDLELPLYLTVMVSNVTWDFSRLEVRNPIVWLSNGGYLYLRDNRYYYLFDTNGEADQLRLRIHKDVWWWDVVEWDDSDFLRCVGSGKLDVIINYTDNNHYGNFHYKDVDERCRFPIRVNYWWHFWWWWILIDSMEIGIGDYSSPTSVYISNKWRVRGYISTVARIRSRNHFYAYVETPLSIFFRDINISRSFVVIADE